MPREPSIVFEECGTPFSDGAKKAIETAKSRIIKPDWKRVFEEADVRKCVDVSAADRDRTRRFQRPV